MKHEIIEFVEQGFNKGVHKDRINGALLEQGHRIDQIEEAFSHVKKKRFTIRLLLPVSIIIILLILGLTTLGFMANWGESDSTVSQFEMGRADRDLFRDAVKTKNLGFCNEIKDNALMEQCFLLAQK